MIQTIKLNFALHNLSSEIVPDEKLDNQCTQKIIEMLKVNSNYDIARVIKAGSTGKRTNIGTSDIDCVVFINDEEPPFEDVLNNFYKCCAQSNVAVNYTVRVSKFALTIRGGNFKLDVVPATNFIKNVKNKSVTGRIQIQQQYVLQRISEFPEKNLYIYSSALAESSVLFMKNRVGFANEMARLAKYWFKSLSFHYISGASTFIELVAVYAARKGQRGSRKNNSYIKCFIRFIKMLMEFEELNVVFGMGHPVFKMHPISDNSRPRVIDPVNPYNNLAKNWKADAREIMKKYAVTTLSRLEKIVNSYESVTEWDMIDALFEPQQMY